jgi:hypothetical protein
MNSTPNIALRISLSPKKTETPSATPEHPPALSEPANYLQTKVRSTSLHTRSGSLMVPEKGKAEAKIDVQARQAKKRKHVANN